jgi:hypothetical protein
MSYRICVVSLLAVAVMPDYILAQANKAEPNSGTLRTVVIKIASGKPGSVERALQYPLLPDPLDLTPGNAALLWIQAGQFAREEQRKLKKGEFSWYFSPKPEEQDNPPMKEAKEFLARFAGPLRVMDLAARRTYCDWGRPPLTIQAFNEGLLPLEEVQFARHLANLLNLRCRFELHNRQFDKATHTLQTGLTLARHLGNSDTLIESIVGYAIAAIMLSRVEEWMGIPGSPDLYWSLSSLPTPFFDVRRAAISETNTIYRSFPALRKLNAPTGAARLNEAEAQRLTDELSEELGKWQGVVLPTWTRKLAMTPLVLKEFVPAKTYLFAHGWTEAEIKALPAVTVVVTFWLAQWDEARDNVLKWMSLPPWQGYAELVKTVEADAASPPKDITVVLRMLFPTIRRTYEAWLRSERHIAVLRCVEAARMYAASHAGKAPAKLSDITAVPLPIDPGTGKGFDDNYTVSDGKAVLEVSVRFVVWRFEMPVAN